MMIYLTYGLLALAIFFFGRRVLKFLIGRAGKRRQIAYMQKLESELSAEAVEKARAKSAEAVEAAKIKALAQLYLDNAGR